MLVGFAAEQAEKFSSDLSGSVTADKDRRWERGDWLGGPIPERLPLRRRRQHRTRSGPRPGDAPDFELSLAGRRPRRSLRAERRGPGPRPATHRPAHIQDTLDNPVYAGMIVRWRGTPREQRRPGRHSALVSPDEFTAVARLTAERDRATEGRAVGGRPSRRVPSGRLRAAGRCGTRMYSITSTYRRKDGTRRRTLPVRPRPGRTGLSTHRRSTPSRSMTACWSGCPGSSRRPTAGCASSAPTAARPSARAWTEHRAGRATGRRTRCARRRANDRYDHEVTLDAYSERAETMLDRLVDARADRKRARPRVQRAAAELTASASRRRRRLAIARRSLHAALRDGDDVRRARVRPAPARAVRRLRRRSRRQRRADLAGRLPARWPATSPTRSTHPDVAAYIERRISELGLRDDP